MTKFIEDLAAELIRQAYAEGYSEGYAQGKFDAEVEGQFEKVKRVVEETPQAKRDRIVEQAKKDVGELRESNWPGKHAIFLKTTGTIIRTHNVEFIVSKEKRTVVVLVRNIYTGRVCYRGIAKCAPGDCFNSYIGRAIALRRALGLEVPAEYLNVPNPTEVRVGDKIRFTAPGLWIGNVETISGFNYKGKPLTHESAGYIDEEKFDIIDDSREEESE